MAIEFKDDRVTNVRLTLIKVLHLMPDDMKKYPLVSDALQSLEEEVETWESYNGMQDPAAPVQATKVTTMKIADQKKPKKKKENSSQEASMASI